MEIFPHEIDHKKNFWYQWIEKAFLYKPACFGFTSHTPDRERQQTLTGTQKKITKMKVQSLSIGYNFCHERICIKFFSSVFALKFLSNKEYFKEIKFSLRDKGTAKLFVSLFMNYLTEMKRSLFIFEWIRKNDQKDSLSPSPRPLSLGRRSAVMELCALHEESCQISPLLHKQLSPFSSSTPYTKTVYDSALKIYLTSVPFQSTSCKFVIH